MPLTRSHNDRSPVFKGGGLVAADNLLLEVKDLRTYFFLDEGVVKAVDGTSFELKRGHTVGVLGESGCGKSVTGLSILRIVQPPGRIVGGEILYHRAPKGRGVGVEVTNLVQLNPYGEEMRSIRGGEIAMVFQEPMTSLDPMYTISDQIVEAIVVHQEVDKRAAKELAVEMLDRVRMPQPRQVADRYPHQLSGGMRQRAMIAMVLSCNPSLLIADEPTTALDVTTEAQILTLMRDLQEDLGMAIMYITHNLGVIAEMAEDVVVMYMGKVVEQADVNTIFYDARHPYTQALLRSIPRIGRRSRVRLESIEGMVPDPYNIPPGCTFHTRCRSHRPGVCDAEEPSLVDIGGGHLVSCLHCAGK
ncbi:MAG: ABC transporter ATP-binding protein [Anaerolineae bacterium]